MNFCKFPSLEEMPKVTIYPQQRIWEFPEGGFQVFEEKLWCPFCQEFVDYMKKCVIKAHVVSRKHAKCRENYHGLGLMHRQGDSSFNGALEAHLQFIKEKMKARRPRAPNSVRANGNVNNDNHTAATMIEAFVNVGIPPRVLGNEKFRTWIKGNLKYSGNLPSPRRLLEVAGPADILETVTECLDKDVCLLLVETAGVVGSGKAVHVLVAPLGNRARFRLLASKVIVPGNSDAVLELVLSTMDVAGIKRWNVVALVSTNVDYLQVAGRQLQTHCRRLHLMTCWNQILRAAMNEVRNRCSVLDQYVTTLECVLDQAPKLQDDLLHALQTSRRFQCAASTNWLKTVNFHAEHIDQELEWISSMDGDGCTVLRLKVLASQPELREQLARIQKIYPGLLKAVEIVDNGELTISSAFWTMHAVVGLLDSAGFPVNELRTQLDMALPSPRFWRIVEMLDPHRVALPEVLQTDCLKELERFDEAPVPPDEVSLYVKTLMANQDRGATQVPAIQFWNAYSRIMPTLSRLAVKVLSLPVTTSYVENRFDVVARSLSASSDERESLAVELRVLFNSKYRESDVN